MTRAQTKFQTSGLSTISAHVAPTLIPQQGRKKRLRTCIVTCHMPRTIIPFARDKLQSSSIAKEYFWAWARRTKNRLWTRPFVYDSASLGDKTKNVGGAVKHKKIFKDLVPMNGPQFRTLRRRVQNVLDCGSLNPNYFYTSRPRPAAHNLISSETATGILWGLGAAKSFF